MPLFRFDHVSKDYITEGRPVSALTDISLEAAPGEFIALVGRSG
jgi:ABC-type glutathione transport system ATPase component